MTKKILIIVTVFVCLAGLSILVLTPKSVPVNNNLNIVNTPSVDKPIVKVAIKDATYFIDGQEVTLKNGVAETVDATNPSIKTTTRYFGNEASADLNGDGQSDVAFLLTQDSGGSGTFYYVAVALASSNGYQGLNTIFLGDRIAPQTTEISDGKIVVNYADRKINESFAVAPSIAISRYFQVKNNKLGEISLPPRTPMVVPIKTSPTPSSTTPSSTPMIKKDIIQLDVPFTTQSPFAEWSDLRQENACEESAAIMAVYWAKGKTFTAQEARDMIVAISDWEKKTYGNFEDTSAQDTVDRIFKKYFDYQKVKVVDNIKLNNIIAELEKGNLVITPMDGQKLGNPFFTPPGPSTHMIVIIGYDYKTKEFIVNESGTKKGKAYRYAQDVLFEAIRDYPTGYHEPIVGIKKNMIVVKK